MRRSVAAALSGEMQWIEDAEQASLAAPSHHVDDDHNGVGDDHNGEVVHNGEDDDAMVIMLKMKLCSLLEEKRAISGGLNTEDNKKTGGTRYLVL